MINKFLKILKTYFISFQVWTSKETRNFELFLKVSAIIFVMLNIFSFLL